MTQNDKAKFYYDLAKWCDQQCFFLDAYKSMLNAAPTPPNTIAITVDEYERLKKDVEFIEAIKAMAEQAAQEGFTCIRIPINTIDKAREVNHE